jgi:DNA polymerase I-like protein with 3'-5' exonuclease and polymerase domains
MTSPTFVAIDVETTLNGNEDVGLAHPMHPDNYVVAFGYCSELNNVPITTYDSIEFEDRIVEEIEKATFCGHNISFDLVHLYRTSLVLKHALQHHPIWDTQLAEYILSAQQIKWSSLDELSIKYGLPVKDDGIKKYFQAGL